MSPSFQKNFITSILLFLVSCATRGLSQTLNDDATVAAKHEQWMEKYGHSYGDVAEKEKRFNVFKENLHYIENFNNAGNKTYKLSTNEFADLTHEEFVALYTNKNMPTNSNPMKRPFTFQNLTDVSPRVDWVEKGAVTNVKHQRSCGCCWAFSAVAAIEGIVQIKTGKLQTLSEQQALDCNTKNWDCNGGWPDDVFDYVVQNQGITTDTNYPYMGMKGACDSTKTSDRAAQITGHVDLPPNDEAALLEAVNQQPVSIVIDGSGRDFQLYGTGVFAGECGNMITHVVTVVGYGTSEDGIKYWLIKNSWGSRWGENGFMRIQRDSGVPGGLCGLARKSSYPII